jgi:flagellar biosynthesis component FlhA/tetratricopeptide (TPR) repeat protein
MSEMISFDSLLNGIGEAVGGVAVGAVPPQESIDSIRRTFEANATLADQHRTLCEQVAAAGDDESRTYLMQLRSAFERQLSAAAIEATHQAFTKSSEDGWIAWLTAFADLASQFPLSCSLRLLAENFPFEVRRRAKVAELQQAIEFMRQSRWDEAYGTIEFLATQDCLPMRTRAKFVTMAGQIQFWWFCDAAAALAWLEKSEKLEPVDGVVLAALGDYWCRQKEYQKAQTYYDRAIQANPRISHGYTGIGDRFAEENKLDLAEEQYRKAISLAGGDSRGYDRMLQLLGRPEILTKREAEFSEVLSTKLAVEPEGAYDSYLDAGQYYMNSKRFSEARAWYEKAFALEEHWPRAYARLAELFQEQGNDNQAEDFGRKAIDLAKGCKDGFIALAKFYEDRGRWQEALSVYALFPPLGGPWETNARASVGRMHAKLENYAEAERILLDELQTHAEDVYVLRAAEELAADYYQKRKDKDSASRVYESILKIKGEQYSGAYRNFLGNMHYVLGDYPSAVAEYKRAIEVEPREATYHRNLSGAFKLLKDYENSERAVEQAYLIDKDETLFNQKKASLANARANDAYDQSKLREAIDHYTIATELDPRQAVYYSNLALAWKRLEEPGNRADALDQAVRCYEMAQKLTEGKTYAGEIDRLRRRRNFAGSLGEKVLGRFNLVSPIAVEVAADLIPLVADAKDTLAPEFLIEVNAIRGRIQEQMGVKVPGIRFRGNETDLPKGSYLIMINEIPIVLGTLSLKQSFCTSPPADLSRRGISAAPASDPATGLDGAWIELEDRPNAESQHLELWNATQYLMRHVEAVLRKNLGEFLGHQEVINLLETNGAMAAEFRDSCGKLTALTTVCRALLSEETPITPFREVVETFKNLDRAGVGLREIVERIRILPSFRDRLPGSAGDHTFVPLGSTFEIEIRRSLRDHQDDCLVLVMLPERCQEALTAVRNRIRSGSFTLVAEDPIVRPFVRKLVELEFPNLHVLSRAEIPTSAHLSAESIVFERDPTKESTEFKIADRNRWAGRSPWRHRAQEWSAPSEISVRVFVSEVSEARKSSADEKPLDEVFALMQDGLFYELGIILPDAEHRVDKNLKPGQFRFRINGVEHDTVTGLDAGEFLVNDTVDRLRLLGLEGRAAVNPANGNQCAIIRDIQDQEESCRQAGLTTWGAEGYLVLCLSSEIRKAAAQFLTDELAEFCLDSLGETFPDLVRIAREQYSLTGIGLVLRGLLEEDISIRDMRSILESVLSIGGTTDVDLGKFIVFFASTDALCPSVTARNTSELTPAELADFVRTSLRRYISHKYTLGANTLKVYLVDPAIEQRIEEATSRPLIEVEEEKVRAAIRDELQYHPVTSPPPVLLTTFVIRRALRKLIEREFPQQAVLSYQELLPELNIQPIARVSW